MMKESAGKINFILMTLLFQLNYYLSNAEEEIIINKSDPTPAEDEPADVVEEKSEFLGEEGDEEDFTITWIVVAIPIVVVLLLVIFGGHTQPPLDMSGRRIRRETLSFHEAVGPKGWRRLVNVWHKGTPDPEDYEPIPDPLPKPSMNV